MAWEGGRKGSQEARSTECFELGVGFPLTLYMLITPSTPKYPSGSYKAGPAQKSSKDSQRLEVLLVTAFLHFFPALPRTSSG